VNINIPAQKIWGPFRWVPKYEVAIFSKTAEWF
jgi:hypothetical protein